jgi:hypothetical protein
MNQRARTGLACLALFGLNALVVWPLFRVEYLDDFQSVEGIFITFGRFLLDYWPHSGWFPWFDAGMPFENTYLPLVSWLVAGIAFLARCSPAHAFHFLTALIYSLGPVFLFLFARKLSGRAMPGFLAALAWSLLSPSSVVPELLRDMGTLWGSRRLMNIVVYGETPHNVSVSLLPLALLLIARALDRASLRRFAVAVLAVATVMLSNTFGIVVVAISVLILVAARDDCDWKHVIRTGAILASAYLLICHFLPPSLMRLIATNSQSIGGDYRFTWKARLIGVAFTAVLIALWAVLRRWSDAALRFALLFAVCFAGIPILFYWQGISFLPQPNRYQLEMDQAVCLLAAFALYPALRRLPRRAAIASTALGVIALAWVTAKNCEFARRLIHPVDISRTVAFREARWIGQNLPGERVLVSGENEFWFNLFADNPQLSAGHDPSAPNWMQRVAVYTIYSGQNAGDQDESFSVFWLKAFGVGAVTVPGPGSRDHYHPIAHPKKFDGLLPLVWREGDDSIYLVPLRSTSLAHVIPVAAIVRRQPIHGLDIGPARAYVAALDDASLPPATLAWDNPERGRISTTVVPGQVVSLQINYDPGWQAWVDGRPLRVLRDQIGLTIIEPDRPGRCVIDIRFNGGTERRVCSAVSLAAVVALLGMLLWPPAGLRRLLHAT